MFFKLNIKIVKALSVKIRIFLLKLKSNVKNIFHVSRNFQFIKNRATKLKISFKTNVKMKHICSKGQKMRNLMSHFKNIMITMYLKLKKK